MEDGKCERKVGKREILESESTPATLRRNITSQRSEMSNAEQTMN